jgi:hypothetical protein
LASQHALANATLPAPRIATIIRNPSWYSFEERTLNVRSTGC